MLRLEFYLPFIRLLAVEGAKQSPLLPLPNDRTKMYTHEGKLFKVFFYEEMIADRNILLNAQTEHSVLQLATTKGIHNLCQLKSVLLGFNHVAYELH